jgi:hypothetical protein
MNISEFKSNLEAHQRISEKAAVGIADLWVDCEKMFGKRPPPAVAVFGRILDKLIATATANGLSNADLVAELECALVFFKGGERWQKPEQ